jgi:acyl-coenzyme A synthetase/AMP-(fatty) acid ligase
VVAAEAVDADRLLEWAAERLAPYKRPREVRFVDELPRNALGKVMRSALTS